MVLQRWRSEYFIDVLNRALAIQKEKLGQDHWETVYTLVTIADVLDDLGKNEEAMEKYQQAMPIYKKEHGIESVNVAGLLNNIANILYTRKQGKYKDAMEKYNISLAVQEKVLGVNLADTIGTCKNIEMLIRRMQT